MDRHPQLSQREEKKLELKTCKSLNSETGVRSKDVTSVSSCKLKKSSSFKEDHQVGVDQPKSGDKVVVDGKNKSSGDNSSVKSPKLSRTESMTERTVQKITKVIRGSSRSDSRSKKAREPSLSPKAAKPDHDKTGTKKTDNVKPECKKADREKKSANEKREIFKSHHSKD